MGLFSLLYYVKEHLIKDDAVHVQFVLLHPILSL